MSGIKYFPKNLNVENKSIILRLDLNVPIVDNKIQDHTRITLAVPFLRELIEKKAKIIIISHLGRPKGIKNKELSLMPIYKYLKNQFKTNIYFFMGNIDNDTKNKSSYLKSGEILLIDNIRFFKGEEENDEVFAKKIASLGEIYINDAFSCSHRKQASIHGITKFIKNSYGGPLLKKEVDAIDLILKNKKKPITCIIGGSKVSSKINVILNLIKQIDKIVIVGAMANNFLSYKGFKIGKSLIEKNSENIIKKIYEEAKIHNCEIIMPLDYSVSTSLNGACSTKDDGSIDSNDIILDIGPKTINIIENIIDKTNTILWNGPAGYFENKNFSSGTNSIAKKISENTTKNSLVSVIGGGDTISAINKIDRKLTFTYLSSAGGAFLEFLEGKDLPGISVLK